MAGDDEPVLYREFEVLGRAVLGLWGGCVVLAAVWFLGPEVWGRWCALALAFVLPGAYSLHGIHRMNPPRCRDPVLP